MSSTSPARQCFQLTSPLLLTCYNRAGQAQLHHMTKTIVREAVILIHQDEGSDSQVHPQTV